MFISKDKVATTATVTVAKIINIIKQDIEYVTVAKQQVGINEKYFIVIRKTLKNGFKDTYCVGWAKPAAIIKFKEQKFTKLSEAVKAYNKIKLQ